nr:hypothetical protein [Mesorhizobium sp. LNJC405B00]
MAQRRLGVDGGVDDRLPGRRDIGLELVDRAQPEMRQVPAHEGLPIALAVAVAQRLIRRQMVFLEAIVGKDAGEAGMADEDGASAPCAQCLCDTDAIQRGAETGFGKQRDGRAGFTRQLFLFNPAG